MLSSSPDSSALWASVPFCSETILILSPCFSAKPRRLTMSEKPASPFGSITPWVQGLGVCAAAGVASDDAAVSATSTARISPDLVDRFIASSHGIVLAGYGRRWSP